MARRPFRASGRPPCQTARPAPRPRRQRGSSGRFRRRLRRCPPTDCDTERTLRFFVASRGPVRAMNPYDNPYAAPPSPYAAQVLPCFVVRFSLTLSNSPDSMHSRASMDSQASTAPVPLTFCRRCLCALVVCLSHCVAAQPGTDDEPLRDTVSVAVSATANGATAAGRCVAGCGRVFAKPLCHAAPPPMAPPPQYPQYPQQAYPQQQYSNPGLGLGRGRKRAVFFVSVLTCAAPPQQFAPPPMGMPQYAPQQMAYPQYAAAPMPVAVTVVPPQMRAPVMYTMQLR